MFPKKSSLKLNSAMTKEVTNETIIIFDFDGTITTKDTMLDFVKWHFGLIKFSLGMLKILPKIILYKIGLISNQKAKEDFLTHFFGGMEYDEFVELCKNYSLSEIDGIIKKEAEEKIKFYRTHGHKMIIITASILQWVEPWALKAGFAKVLASEIEVKNSKVTGKIMGKNCYGIEKVNRFISEYNSFENYHTVCFGDSKGDFEILKSSNKSYYKKYE
jgi:HAD superfamily hydrolase (TIGR01490 family)